MHYCLNPECNSRKIEKMIHFASRNAMDIDGMGANVIEEFFAEGFLHDIADIYHLSDHATEIKELDGWSDKSMNSLLDAIEASRNNLWNDFFSESALKKWEKNGQSSF